MWISYLIQHHECKEGHLMAIKFKQFWIKLAKILAFIIFAYNVMCYTWINLRIGGVYVFTNHNLKYLAKKSLVYNHGLTWIFICNKKPNTQLMTKNLLLLYLDISKQFLYISCEYLVHMVL
jgi:hypothetical protein